MLPVGYAARTSAFPLRGSVGLLVDTRPGSVA